VDSARPLLDSSNSFLLSLRTLTEIRVWHAVRLCGFSSLLRLHHHHQSCTSRIHIRTKLNQKNFKQKLNSNVALWFPTHCHRESKRCEIHPLCKRFNWSTDFLSLSLSPLCFSSSLGFTKLGFSQTPLLRVILNGFRGRFCHELKHRKCAPLLVALFSLLPRIPLN